MKQKTESKSLFIPCNEKWLTCWASHFFIDDGVRLFHHCDTLYAYAIFGIDADHVNARAELAHVKEGLVAIHLGIVNHLAELVCHDEAFHTLSLDGDITVGRVGEETGLEAILVYVGGVLHRDTYRAVAIVAFRYRSGSQHGFTFIGAAPSDQNGLAIIGWRKRSGLFRLDAVADHDVVVKGVGARRGETHIQFVVTADFRQGNEFVHVDGERDVQIGGTIAAAVRIFHHNLRQVDFGAFGRGQC